MARVSYPKISLEAARINCNLTQKEAAKHLGISRYTLQNYESGKTIPNWDVVKKMEALYKISFDYIEFIRNTSTN